MLSSFLKESDLRRSSKDFYFSWSRVIDSCKFILDKSGRVIMCSGYLIVKEVHIERWVPRVAVAVRPNTTAGDFLDFLLGSVEFVIPSFSLIISLILRYVGLKLWLHSDAQ